MMTKFNPIHNLSPDLYVLHLMGYDSPGRQSWIENFVRYKVKVDESWMSRFESLLNRYDLSNHHDTLLWIAIEEHTIAQNYCRIARKSLRAKRQAHEFANILLTSLTKKAKSKLVLQLGTTENKASVKITDPRLLTLLITNPLKPFIELEFTTSKWQPEVSEVFWYSKPDEGYGTEAYIQRIKAIAERQVPKDLSSFKRAALDKMMSNILVFLEEHTQYKVRPQMNTSNKGILFLYELVTLLGWKFDRGHDGIFKMSDSKARKKLIDMIAKRITRAREDYYENNLI